MFTKYARTWMTGVLLCVALATGTALASTRTFTAASGNWSAAGNWQSGILPVTGDDVVIGSYNSCNYDLTTSEPQVKSLTVTGGATLTINSGRSLELATDGTSISEIGLYASVVLSSSTSQLIVLDSHTITGYGKILGQDDSASIVVYDGKTLTLDTSAAIEGRLKIVNQTSTGGTFENKGTVHANASGTLWVNPKYILDTATGLWKSSTASSVLRFDSTLSGFIGPVALDGDFTIDAGALDVDFPGLDTDGTLTWTGGVIDCATSGGSATFRGS